MKLLFFSDLHSHAHPDFDEVLPDGESARLTDILSVFDSLARYAKKYRVDAVIFGGDMFHTPRAVLTRTFQRTYEAAERFVGQVGATVPWIINVGNHDLPLLTKGSPVSSLYAFSRLGARVVVGEPQVLTVGGRSEVDLHVVPYMQDPEQVQQAVRGLRITKNQQVQSILLLHCGIAEAVVGPNEVRLDAPLALKDLRLDEFTFVLAGHYHKPQRLHRKAAIIGSPMQHNMLDRGEERGLVLYDTDTRDIKRLPLDGPRFHLLEVNDPKDLALGREQQLELAGGYVRVLIRTPRVEAEKVRRWLESVKVRKHDVKVIKTPAALERDRTLTAKVLAGVGRLEGVLDDYVARVNPDELDHGRLAEIGRELLDGEKDDGQEAG